MPHRLLERMELKNSAVSSWLSTTQRSYKRHFGENVQRELICEIQDYVFVAHSQSASIELDAVNEMASRWYRRILRRAAAKYKDLSVKSHRVAVEENSIPKTVSMDRHTVSLTSEQVRENRPELKHTTQQKNENQQTQNAFEDAKPATKGDIAVPQEGVVSRIMYPVDPSQGRRWTTFRPIRIDTGKYLLKSVPQICSC